MTRPVTIRIAGRVKLILIWSGSVVSIPEGWYLCDGANGTPDLSGRFVRGPRYVEWLSGFETPGPSVFEGANQRDRSHRHQVDDDLGPESDHTHLVAAATTDFTGDYVGLIGSDAAGSVPNDDMTHQHNVPEHRNAAGSPHLHMFTTPDVAPDSNTVDTRPPYYALCYIQGMDTFPVGTVAMCAGAASAIPTGWHICNGQNGTPNLYGQFVIGVGEGYPLDDTFGGVSIALDAPGHSHTKGSVTADGGGHHQHPNNALAAVGGVSAGAHGVYPPYHAPEHYPHYHHGPIVLTDEGEDHTHEVPDTGQPSIADVSTDQYAYVLYFVQRLS